jgi:hypothetical protein
VASIYFSLFKVVAFNYPRYLLKKIMKTKAMFGSAFEHPKRTFQLLNAILHFYSMFGKGVENRFYSSKRESV